MPHLARLSRRGLLAGVPLLAAPAIGRAATPAQMTITAGHPPNFLWVKVMQDTFLPEVNRRLEAAGKRPIRWNEAYGGTVARIGGELQAIQSGVSDLGIAASLFQASELPLHNVTYAAPFGTPDIGLVVRVMDGLNERIPAMRDGFRRFRATLLAGAGSDDYHLFTTFPVRRFEDLNGKKIAAPGPAALWFRNTGAVPVAANLNAYYNDIKLGVYDGCVTFASAAAAAKIQEVAPHITKVSIGAQYFTAIVMNLGVWDRLDAVEKAAFTGAAGLYQAEFIRQQTERAVSGMAQMAEHGGQVAEFPEEERRRWAAALPNIGGDWAAAMQGRGLPGREVLDGYMDGIKAGGAHPARDWRA